MKKNYFELAYTRDRHIITQYAWQNANHKGIEKLLNIKLPFTVGMIVYVNDGPIEDWDNKEAAKFIENKILEKNKKDSEFLLKVLSDYNEKLHNYFEPTWKKTSKNIKEVKKFADEFYAVSVLFAYIWISISDKRTPSKYSKCLEEWRNQDDFFGGGSHFLEKSLEAIYPKLKGVVNYITEEEINDPPDMNILEKRKINFLRVSGKRSKIMSLPKFLKENKEFVFLYPKTNGSKIIKGQIACRGKANGKVKIVKMKSDIEKVKTGDVIVSPMSVPEFLPAMKKASAFVTDEGGMMCHAAIVAREMKKPCIIGTKIATKVLKDGDLVEVDADEGVVRILK